MFVYINKLRKLRSKKHGCDVLAKNRQKTGKMCTKKCFSKNIKIV